MTMGEMFAEGANTSGSLFSDFGITDWSAVEAPADNSVPPGVYRAIVSNAEIKVGKTGIKGFIITYTVTEPEAHKGKTQGEFKRISPPEGWNPNGDNTNELKEAFENQAKYLKARLVNLGIPETRIGVMVPSDIINKAVVITLVKNKQYINVNEVKLDTANSNGATTAAASNVWA